MKILVCNAGSTSLKFKLFLMPEERVLAQAKIERIGDDQKGKFSFSSIITNKTIKKENIDIPDYQTGISIFLDELIGNDKTIPTLGCINAVGFKTVIALGYPGVCELTPDVLAEMKNRIDISPLHNKVYYNVISTFKDLCGSARLIGVFETNFHSQRPLYSKLYGVPYSWYEDDKIQRYGFHGASHGYIADRVRDISGRDAKIISCHLGGSSSVCAISEGKSLDISSGFSPQTGLPNANRTGDLDVYALVYKLKQGNTFEKILEDLTTNGGLHGISGVSSDLRDIEIEANAGNQRAKLAIEVLCYNIAKYIGSYYVTLGGLDYLVFTGGIGENSVSVREGVCRWLECLGLRIEPELNKSLHGEGRISADNFGPEIWVIPTDEELRVARQMMSICS